jgi:hypothetical protein
VLEEYTKAHPATTRAEIRAAVRMAQMSTAAGNQATAVTAISLALGLVVAFLGFGLFYFRSAGEAEFTPVLPMIIVALIVAIAIGMFVVRNR